MEIELIDKNGKASGKTQLPDQWFACGKAKNSVMHEVVRAYLMNQRQGTHESKTRSFVSGGGKKPWKQKHTGRARSGSSRSPLWRGGGIIHGPHPRSYRVDLPHEKIKSALSQALSSKTSAGNVIVSEKPVFDAPKTRKLVEWIKQLSLPNSSLLVLDKKDATLARAARNLKNFSWIESKHLHPYHVLKAKKIVFTPEAVQCL